MKQFVTFLFTLLLVALGLLVARGASGTPLPEFTPSSTNISVTSSAPSGALYIRQRSSTGNEIQRIDIKTKQKVTVINIKNKDLPILNLSPISTDGTSLLTASGTDKSPIGKLISLAVDGSNTRTTLSDTFVATPSLTLSPDNAKIVYTETSSDDTHPGTRIILMDVTGSNKRVLTTETLVWGIRFSSDGKTIAYVRNQDNEDQVVERDLTTDKETVLYRSGQAITQFDWSAINLMIIGTGSDEDTALLLFNPTTHDSQPIPNITAVAGSATLAPDASGIAYQKNNEILILSINDQQQTSYGTGYQIIGWTR